jgi:hypothetical protein
MLRACGTRSMGPVIEIQLFLIGMALIAAIVGLLLPK